MFAFFVPSSGIGGNYSTGNMDTWIAGNAFTIGGGANAVPVRWTDIFVIVFAILLMFGVQRYIKSSELGKAMRASAQDRDAAHLRHQHQRDDRRDVLHRIGARRRGGVVYETHYHVIQWNLGYRFGIIAFTAAVLGGIGNILGAGVGGFVIGLVAVFSRLIAPQRRSLE